jgi:hypothetical protein
MNLWQRIVSIFRRPARVKVTRAMEAQARVAMEYAERAVNMNMPCPAEWHWVRGEYERDGIWYHSGAGARCQFLPRSTRIVVYCGPHGEQSQEVYNHEAGHAVLRVHGHPAKYKKHFKNWVDV